MRIPLIVAAALAAFMSPALSEPLHDQKLEQAVKDIVARKMRLADMRGSFAYGQMPAMVAVAEAKPAKTGVVDARVARHSVETATPSILTIDPGH